MERSHKPIVILIAEDDDDDFLLMMEAFEESRLLNAIYRVKNGEELMHFLTNENTENEEMSFPKPALILLDLNMPKMDGREALKAIKSNPELHTIPVIVLTTSGSEEDIMRSYELGANSYVRKPVKFDEFLAAVSLLRKYWVELVALPTADM